MSRFGMAWRAFWGLLRSPELAARWAAFLSAPAAPAAPAVPTPSAATVVSEPSSASADAAVFTLVLLQREGRLVDFLQEPLEGFSDAQVGAAARQIQADCRRVLQKVFGVEPLRQEAEGSEVTIPAGFDARHVRLSGSAHVEPPCTGILRHRGWRATRADLPQRHPGLDPRLICPAEVDVGG
ncbi:MAG: DUF2760 domain-containing protein [Lentisphaerae bacterium]|nr:DUF2760 domain-containing protein [Lentisphaerota bacterium]